jgi:hypothetical protein
MNFYTSIFKPKSPKTWILKSLFGAMSIIVFLFGFNYLIDPYNITKFNLLNIKYKFARDDRTEKVNFFKTLDKFDNILVGSSRVYSINPRKVSQIIGGSTYNFGVGTATVEDHLGILLYLQKNHKLPKTLIIGVDFYTFNPNTPPNSYFLGNQELNFLSYANQDSSGYWSKFLSLDATRASFKTLKNHIKNKNEKPRFDTLGWGSAYFDDSKRNLKDELPEIKAEIEKNRILMYSDFKYRHIDKKRIEYYEKIKQICKQNNIQLYIFTTPLNPILLQTLDSHQETKNAIKEFKAYLATFENFTNFYDDKEFTDNMYNFQGATHTTANAGDVIMEKVLK